ncbi:MAG: hypothetical protein O2955_13390 [Planctomycetota bacterium]|nr:hypothetical protein [Planctomycetota bacterium]MDA1213504.1 hypothetical protein [Planctomycetota bacterium]
MAKSLSASLVDKARHTLCNRICESFREGAVSVRIRKDTQPAAVWFYEKQDRSWKKRGEAIDDARLVSALEQELDSFVSRKHDSTLSIRSTIKPDWNAVELAFHADDIRDHLSALESYVYGVLFYKHPDHEHDIRQRVRRGPRMNGRR